MSPEPQRPLPPHEFDARVVIDGDGPVVVVRGEIDLATVTYLDAALTEAIAVEPRITIDLRETSFMDSTGAMTLVAAHRRLGQIPEAIVLRDPSPSIRRVLALAGIDHLFTVQASNPSGAVTRA